MYHRDEAKELRAMIFVEGPEKLLIVVADMCQMLFTGLQHLCLLPVKNRVHRCHALICGSVFSVGHDQVAQRQDQGIRASLVVGTIALECLFPPLMDETVSYHVLR